MTELNAGTLASLQVPVPEYDRDGLATGVVHIGVGAFHRAHQAMFHDRLLQEGKGTEWAICGAGVLASDARLRDALGPQDHLYTLVLKHADGTYEPRVIGSHVDYVDAAEDWEPLVARIADPGTRIVSLTVTEGGYTEDNHTFDLLVQALGRRRDAGTGPLTVMSCDNLEHNGQRARDVTLARARAADEALADWIEAEVTFPSSMVDRITPRTTDEDRDEVAERFGIEDRWPVVCEPFVQWVLEDAFAAGRPPYEDAGVQVVDDVRPYELMKLRLLNAGHQALCYFASLAGFELVHDAAQDDALRAFVAGYMEHEGTPTLAPVPGVDLAEYRETLLERFANPQVRDTIARLCAESSDRIPRWLVPVIQANLANGGEVRRSAAIVASWTRYAEGVDEQGEPIEVVDSRAQVLTERANASRQDPLAFVRDRELFGDIADDERFTKPYLEALESLRTRGARATIDDLARSPSPGRSASV
jgi:mannitol 2-dehydrogenase